ncbi:hypothetical protein A33Q_2609 [Indibacter alkaliphilus LW1]|uniref:Aminoglycoside phosphotransferase domain-containing protein n=1 Tax=Indibacter alkaliphilus (strain CCUG 57479 / KCTC 22604 / LW1) TaxID=1189612 RepID=S2DVC1_INDAL|nr:aminoglycoside phosphotransferase family protein [Indibacter alkaliphilus]EOZ96016.1 hypothetical protein A33Q_2609 [Indibacter alkaliphilus LW1]
MQYPWLSFLEKQYPFSIKLESIQAFGDGHIHHTYLVDTSMGKMILQKFNNKVFTAPEKISHNHLIMLRKINRKELPFELPLPIPNKRGEVFSKLEDGIFRFSPFVQGACVNEVQEPQHAFLASKAFSQLIDAGKHIRGADLKEVIPGFNDLSLRYHQLLTAVEKSKRVLNVELKELIDFYLGREDLVKEYKAWAAKLPLRLTHNDTKINNLIFSGDLSTVKAVIDLDTIMAGFAFYDFGDLVRTVACTEHEHSTAWEKISVDKSKYEALYQGFCDGGSAFLTKDEIASLHFGGKMMTCIMGFRFLADYLNGNIYYQIKYEAQNFHRAKNHMYLLNALDQIN